MPFPNRQDPQVKFQIRFACDECGQTLGPAKAGETVHCKRCKIDVQFPEWPGGSTCWYCRNRPGTKSHLCKIYELVGGSSSFLGQTSTFEYVRRDVEVPVCESCAEAHAIQKSFDGGKLGLLTLLAVFFIFLAFAGALPFILMLMGQQNVDVQVALAGGALTAVGGFIIYLVFRYTGPFERKAVENSKGSLCGMWGRKGAAEQVVAHPEVHALLSQKTIFPGLSPGGNNDISMELAE